jgi:hypothetical protein
MAKSFFFMAKFLLPCKTILLHGVTSSSWQKISFSWLNLYILAKPFHFMPKLLPLGKSFLLHG